MPVRARSESTNVCAVIQPPVEVATQVRAILSEHLGCQPDRLLGSARLAEDLGADSLDVADLMNTIEQVFAIELEVAEAARWVRVWDVVELVHAKLALAEAR